MNEDDLKPLTQDELIQILTDANIELQDQNESLLRRIRSEAVLDLIDSLQDHGLVRPSLPNIIRRLRDIVKVAIPSVRYTELCGNLGIPTEGEVGVRDVP